MASIKGHEAGRHKPDEPYRPLYRKIYGKTDHELFGAFPGSHALVSRNDGDVLFGGDFSPFMDLTKPRPADTEYVLTLRTVNQQLVALDNTYGGADLVPIACRVFRSAYNRLATGQYLSAVERDLQAAAGETGEIAAWIAYDADRQSLSRQLIHEAMLISRLAGDRGMELFQTSHLSMQGVYLRRSREALRAADSVLDRGRVSGRTAALFHLRRARALAQLEEETGAFNALGAARAQIGDGVHGDDPQWTWWLDDHELSLHEAVCHSGLGSWGRAVEAIGHAVEGCEAGRTRCHFNDRSQQLEILVQAGAWQEAEPVLITLLPDVGEVGSLRTVGILAAAAKRLEASRAALSSTLSDATTELRKRVEAVQTGI
ncbi:hypothetical protein [Streptosporangium sp. NPDC051022]|uniref:hypothetical protein n=1 Tax=Streptosporangium sp. NPDC051022 TaxID=3155752 RepID=UPI00344113CF